MVDDGRQTGEPFPVDRVTCSASDSTAELHFPLPRFDVADGATDGVAFSQLSDGQLSEYRENLRRRLDGQIDRFNPHVLHAQHVWLEGQLALETGVPYVLNAWHDELAGPAADARFQDLVAQAAENANRILVPDEAVRSRVAAAFDGAADRTMIMPRKLHAGAGRFGRRERHQRAADRALSGGARRTLRAGVVTPARQLSRATPAVSGAFSPHSQKAIAPVAISPSPINRSCHCARNMLIRNPT